MARLGRNTTSRNRHRGIRSQVQGPYLPPLTSVRDQFLTVVADTASYLTSLWPDELENVRLDVADVPSRELSLESGQRWLVDRDSHLITLYRLPIQRAGLMRGLDKLHAQMLVEYYVFRAFADYIGKDPWELAPDRFRPF